MQKIFANVPVFDGGGRAATTTFAQRNIGDALCTFESEVNLIKAEFGDSFEVVYPKSTILAENPVAVIDKVVDKKGTRKQAEGYLKFLWTRRGARRSPPGISSGRARRRCSRSTPRISRRCRPSPSTRSSAAGRKAQKEHFDDGAIYDQILAAKK